MIISASRRTDITAFYSEWFFNRINEGYCTIFNPFNRNQVKYVPLDPKNVDVIVFWTKDSKPIRPRLDELDDLGYNYYFQYTLNKYPKTIEKNLPAFKNLMEEFLLLSNRIGNDRIYWRYDPIILSKEFTYDFHIQNFKEIAGRLNGATHKVVISIVDLYKKTLYNIRKVINENEIDMNPTKNEGFYSFIRELVSISTHYNMEIQSCAEPAGLSKQGVKRGKCIDDEFIKKTFKLEVTSEKDKGQRMECGCVKSTDIGVYDTCIHGCQYCYATKNHKLAVKNYNNHNVNSPSLIGWYEANKPDQEDPDLFE